MENNERLIQKVRKILNTNKACQDMMEILVNKAKAVGMSAEQFEQFKASLMTNIILKMALEHEDIKAFVNRVKEVLLTLNDDNK